VLALHGVLASAGWQCTCLQASSQSRS
jgi:hypothetical protein